MFFIQTLWSNPVYFFMVALIVIFSVCLHEYFHAQAGVWEGDESLVDHLTLNPLKQMGFLSILMLAIIGIAWGAVPVDRSQLRSRWSMLKVSLAGPAANLLLLILAWVLFALSFKEGLYRQGAEYQTAQEFILLLGVYNFILLIFNLVPAPGLDGWNVVAELFPRLRNVSSELVKGIMLFIMLAAFMGIGLLYGVGFRFMELGVRFFSMFLKMAV